MANLAPEHRETEGMSLTQHLTALGHHGVTVDVVVCDPAAFEAAGGICPVDDPDTPLTVGETEAPVRLVTAALAGPGGRDHHTGHLAAVLRALVEG